MFGNDCDVETLPIQARKRNHQRGKIHADSGIWKSYLALFFAFFAFAFSTLTFFAVVFFLAAVFFLTVFLAARKAPTFFEERPTPPAP